ncbi:zinc-dependent peptidase [Flavobacterium sp. xlx-214]|uniref:zinc-dependent peptidase n=1 Tax=unclassified Flavobacterium TaxID=196869 RepID=UPI0013D22FCA|nr:MULTISPECIES: zinc-dependent peptidase [unclassified Flavobacterium]MBA5793020.1 zinc-dependent peptidase [Flavobacterium sp. xlx-221]QMI84652.1 zinc-dependent peptidase [Flavobacterium sp. xlx-214]
MFFSGSRLFYDQYRLDAPKGNFELKLTPEQLIYQYADSIAKVFPLFNQLPHRFKLNFNNRILSFLKQYAFAPQQNAPLTNAHKIEIAASYVKLTLGYNQFLINSFDKIVVYPTAQYFSHLNETHTGHFNPKMKVVMLALDEFEHDIKNNQDGKDLALHEFTHALCFEMMQPYAKHPDSDSFRKGFRLIHQWMEAPENTSKINQINFLRSYAFTSRLELISVLIELFFEKETLFKTHFPDLYSYTGNMIKHPKTKSIAK